MVANAKQSYDLTLEYVLEYLTFYRTVLRDSILGAGSKELAQFRGTL